MLQAHSLLWNYLWVAPNVLLLLLALLMWRRGRHRTFPVFAIYALVSALGQLAVYVADIAPWVAAETFWRVDWVSLVSEGVLKFALIAEIFAQAFDPYPSLARLGKYLIRGVGVALVLGAALAAAYAPKDNANYSVISGAHLLEQTIYLIESGLLAFIFVFSAYFRLSLCRPLFGIALGLSISSCIHLANWAIIANAGLPNPKRAYLDILGMATYHVCVLIWFYYLLVPPRVAKKSAVSLPENNLAIWNRELERLLHS
ncbi:MAG TPA: hypothetical protein VMH04_04890 [Candidatus Solibacter sp.]|nr:hypothetical protein [Candidatus Solibacter sp.]